MYSNELILATLFNAGNIFHIFCLLTNQLVFTTKIVQILSAGKLLINFCAFLLKINIKEKFAKLSCTSTNLKFDVIILIMPLNKHNRRYCRVVITGAPCSGMLSSNLN